MSLIKTLFKISQERYTKGEIGIEVEVEGKRLPESNDLWKKVRDGSLKSEESAEYVLRYPLSVKDSFAALDNLDAEFVKYKSTFDESIRAGVHIHINVQDMTLVQLANFMVTYMILEEVLVHFCGESREGNLFCLRATDAPYLVEALRLVMGKRDYKFCTHDSLRYSSMNVVSLPKYGSLEFRVMRSTRDFGQIKLWINLLIQVRNYSQSFEFPEEIITSFSQGDYLAFIRESLGDYYILVKDTLGLEDMIKRGMRNAQDVAYCTDWKKYLDGNKLNIFSEIEELQSSRGNLSLEESNRLYIATNKIKGVPSGLIKRLSSDTSLKSKGPSTIRGVTRVGSTTPNVLQRRFVADMEFAEPARFQEPAPEPAREAQAGGLTAEQVRTRVTIAQRDWLASINNLNTHRRGD